MNAHVYPSQQEKVISGAGAFGMHLLFLALLVFGVNWQKKVEPQANIVDLWTNLPSQVKPAPPPPPPPPEVRPQAQPVEPPKATVKPEVAKPDIAMKDKVEKERRMQEEKKKEAKKREEEQAAQKQQAAEAQRLAREQEDAQRKVAEQAAAAQAKLRDEYIERIRAKIRSRIIVPPNLQGNPRVEFYVALLPKGEVLDVRTKSGSNNTAWDNAVERAIRAAQPMPMPPDPNLLNEFRRLELGFRPHE